MKQKIVIEVKMRCQKCRIKSMEIVATAPGVESVAIGGEGKITVVGDDVDFVSIVSTLRKKIGKTDVISLEEVKEEKKVEEVKKAVKKGGEQTNNNVGSKYQQTPYPYAYHYQGQIGPYSYNYY